MQRLRRIDDGAVGGRRAGGGKEGVAHWLALKPFCHFSAKNFIDKLPLAESDTHFVESRNSSAPISKSADSAQET